MTHFGGDVPEARAGQAPRQHAGGAEAAGALEDGEVPAALPREREELLPTKGQRKRMGEGGG